MIRHAGSSGGAVAVLAALAVVAFCPAAALAGGQDCRDAVPVGETPTASGSVSGTAPVYYRFEVAASALYRVYSSGETDTVGQLLNADCRVISEDDDGGQGLNFLIERELEPGTHYVAVRGYSAAASGPYTLHVETGPGGPHGGSGCYDAEPMPPGSTVSGTVRGTAWRFFSFTLSSPSAVTIITEGPTDTIGQLLDADCNRIVDDDDGGEGTNFRIETELEPGAYYVAVRGYNDATSGPYTLRVGLPGGARQGGVGGGAASAATRSRSTSTRASRAAPRPTLTTSSPSRRPRRPSIGFTPPARPTPSGSCWTPPAPRSAATTTPARATTSSSPWSWNRGSTT